MNSLMNYGSDDDSQEEKPVDPYVSSGRNYRRSGTGAPTDDTNYDEVQMSLSEDSDAESKSPSKHSRDRERDERRNSPKIRESSNRDRRDDRLERDRCSGRDRNEDRPRRDRDDERSRPRDEKDDRTRSRDDDKNRDRTRDRDDDKRDRKARSRDRYSSRDDRYRSDRDRRRSRSPRDRERRRSRSPRRSRSRSRDRNSRGGFQRRFDRGNKIDKNDFKDRGNNSSNATQDQDMQKDRFFMPGITGRFRDQIEKRKLLWQKKEPEVPTAPIPATSQASQNTNAPRATKVWESTTFAQDTDGKVASKFKRLMGIRTSGEGGSSTNSGGTILKKQDEMFSAMEQQYEVARTTTHTMRGVGLGFSSFNR